MLSAASLPPPQPQPASTRRVTTTTTSSSSVLKRGRSAAMKKLRSFAAAPEPSARATEPFARGADRAAPAAGDDGGGGGGGGGVARASLVGAVLHRGEAAREEQKQRTAAAGGAPRRRDLCTPTAEVEEWLERWSAMAEFEMSVAVGCGFFGGVDYHGVVEAAEGEGEVVEGVIESEGESDGREFVDCRVDKVEGAS